MKPGLRPWSAASVAAGLPALPWRWALGLSLFAMLASLPALHLAIYQDRPWALLSVMGVLVAGVEVWKRPMVAAAAIVATSLFLQIGYVGVGYSDQIDLGRSALARVLDGDSPYGFPFTNRTGGLNPFAYGPLAMLTAIPGPALELAASAALLATIAATRSWLTLCLVAGFPPFIYQAPTGINDYSVALLLTVALLALPTRPRTGIALLAVAAAVKPYAAAWFLPAIGFAGWGPGMWLIGVSLVLWSPLLVWGVGSYVESMRQVASATAPSGWASNTFPLTWIRLLAVPLALAGLLVRRWEHAVLVGAAAFIAVMFFGRWASLGYWVAVLPITGIALEGMALTRYRSGQRGEVGQGNGCTWEWS